MYPDEPDRIIPLIAEHLHVEKREIVTNRLRVTTSIEERAVLIEDEIERGNLHVERIAVERAVSEAPAPRQDGNTLIVSVVEERLVAEKRLFVIEELHITRTTTTEPVAIPETVRVMHAAVEHLDPVSPAGETASRAGADPENAGSTAPQQIHRAKDDR